MSANDSRTYPDDREDMSAEQVHAHEIIEEIVMTAADHRLPLQVGAVQARIKGTGQEVWVIGRANPQQHGGGSQPVEPLAVVVNDALLDVIDFGSKVHKAGTDERSQRNIKADFGVSVPADDAALAVPERVEQAVSGIEQLIESVLKGNTPVGAVRLERGEDGQLKASPVAAWPFATTETKQ